MICDHPQELKKQELVGPEGGRNRNSEHRSIGVMVKGIYQTNSGLFIPTNSLGENSLRSLIASNSANNARVFETDAFPGFSWASFRNWKQFARRL